MLRPVICKWYVIPDVFLKISTTCLQSVNIELDGGEELMFVYAKQVIEYVKDEAQVFVILASLEANEKGVVRDLPVVCEFPGVFPEDINDLPPE